MTTNKAVEVLKKYNAWRRGAETNMPHPADIGLAIEIVINEITNRKFRRERIKKTNNDDGNQINQNKHEENLD